MQEVCGAGKAGCELSQGFPSHALVPEKHIGENSLGGNLNREFDKLHLEDHGITTLNEGKCSGIFTFGVCRAWYKGFTVVGMALIIGIMVLWILSC